MTLRARRTDTGETVEVLDIASGRLAFVAPPGANGVGGYLMRADLLDPDPWFLAALGRFPTPWRPVLPDEAEA